MSFSITLKKAINFILTGSMSIVFAACYGAQMELENPKAIKAMDENEEAIPGLKVSILEDQKEIGQYFTDKNGFIEFQLSQDANKKYSAKIEDVDGDDNLGDFETKEINLNTESYIEINLDKKN